MSDKPLFDQRGRELNAALAQPRCSEWTSHEKHIFVELQCLINEHEDGEERVRGIIRYAEWLIQRKRERAA